MKKKLIILAIAIVVILLPVRAFLGQHRQYRSIYRRHGSWLDGQSLVRETHRLTG